MAVNGEFIVKFIAESASQGLDALEAAKQEISKIDEKLQEAEKLKIRRMNLIAILDHFGDETHRRRKASNLPKSEDIDDDSEHVNLIKEKIKKAISIRPYSVRELILEVGSYDQDSLIIRTVKRMGDQEIITRDSEGRVQPGRNFENV